MIKDIYKNSALRAIFQSYMILIAVDAIDAA